MKLIGDIIWILMGLITIIWSGYMIGSELTLFNLPQNILLFLPLFPIGIGMFILYTGIQQNHPLHSSVERK